MSDDESSVVSSDVDESSDDDDDDDKVGGLGAFIEKANAKQKKSLGDYNAFDDDDDNTIAQKMRTIIALRDTLGMNKDPQWLAHEAQKEADLKRQANMTMEDKVAETGDMFSRLKARHGNLLEKKQAERKSLQLQANQRKAMEQKLKVTEAAVRKEVDTKGEQAVNEQIEADLEEEKQTKGKKKVKKKAKGTESGGEGEAPAGKKKKVKKKKPKAGDEDGAEGVVKKKKKKKPPAAAAAEGEDGGKKKVKKKKPAADGVVKKKKKKKPAA